MEIKDHEVELLIDPTGILSGDRYEFFLDIEVAEDDELSSVNGLKLRVIFAVTEEEQKILHYEFIESATNSVLDFALEEEEKDLIYSFCKKNYKKAIS